MTRPSLQYPPVAGQGTPRAVLAFLHRIPVIHPISNRCCLGIAGLDPPQGPMEARSHSASAPDSSGYLEDLTAIRL
jgi:hypothetical protein